MKNLKLSLIAIMLVIGVAFGLVSCGGNSSQTTTASPQGESPESVNVMVFSGTTGFGMAPLMDKAAKGESKNNYNFSVEETNVENVLAALVNGSVDIAALPTNAAALAYNRTGGEVQMLALNTKGVLYLLETGEKTIESFEDLRGKTVYVPVQNPSFVFEALCRQNGLVPGVDITINSTMKPAELAELVKNGGENLSGEKIVEYAVLPQPLVTVAQKASSNAGKSVSISLDLTEEWNKAFKSESQLIQGCVVVRKDFATKYPSAVADFLTEYEESINFVNSNPEEASQMIVAQGIFAQAPIAKLAIPKCNIFLESGEGMKALVHGFLSALYSVNPNSVGGAIPGDDFYY